MRVRMARNLKVDWKHLEHVILQNILAQTKASQP